MLVAFFKRKGEEENKRLREDKIKKESTPQNSKIIGFKMLTKHDLLLIYWYKTDHLNKALSKTALNKRCSL